MARSGEVSRVEGGEAKRQVLLSVILPVLGDSSQGIRRAEQLQGFASEEGLGAGSLETIVVVADAGIDQSGMGEDDRGAIRVLRGHRPSRGGQMRSGAAVARGRLLVFHHSDNPIGRHHLRSLVDIAAEEDALAGAFYRDLGHCWPGLGFLMPVARWWQRNLGILYGDQTCFVRREVYDAVGGMPDMVLMEDVEFSRRLRRRGGMRLLDPPVRPDMSRFRRDGRWRRKLENLLLIILFRLGVSPTSLGRIYQGR